ncbi:MAG TPA: sterol desaturase family protein, partial [Myxococcota bacterium]|nr:sterol desaturase family protein [Myxococcota bacterium]
VYKSLTYPLLAFFGFDGGVLFALAVVGTAVGHFNHANLDVSIGPLKYIINSPAMHVWHHAHPDCGPPPSNFGITLSLWDWLFGTAYLPARPPQRLAFAGVETFPRTVPGQILHPVPIERILRHREQRAEARS